MVQMLLQQHNIMQGPGDSTTISTSPTTSPSGKEAIRLSREHTEVKPVELHGFLKPGYRLGKIRSREKTFPKGKVMTGAKEDSSSRP